MADDPGGTTVRGTGARLLGVVHGEPGHRVVVWEFHGVIWLVQEIKARDESWGPAGEVAITHDQAEKICALIERTSRPPKTPPP